MLSMGQSADARLIYGFDGGDLENNHYPLDWMRKMAEAVILSDGEADIVEHIRAQVSSAFFGAVDVITYGWESTSFAVGVSLAWAIDYGNEAIPLEAVTAAAQRHRPAVVTVAQLLGAPVDFEPSLLILASYH